MSNEKNKSPFIVFGASKSGTTWLQKLIDSHPDIKCHFQLPLFAPSKELLKDLNTPIVPVYNRHKDPFKGVFSDKRKQEEYWLKLSIFKSIVPSLNSIIQDAQNKYSISQTVGDEILKEVYRNFINEFLKSENETFVGTKAYSDFEMLFDLYPDAKVISIVRDGRDVCVSKRFHMAKRGVYYHGDERNKLHYILNKNQLLRRFLRKVLPLTEKQFALPTETEKLLNKEIITKFATDWCQVNRYILDWSTKKSDNFLVIRYEDLKVNQKYVIGKVLKFLGAEVDETILEGVIAQNDFNKLKKGKKDSFFRKGQVGDWKNYFNDKQLHIFNQIAEITQKDLGYE
jgi:hypothetical protein